MARKATKIISITAVSLLLIIIALTVLIKIYITPDKVKEFLIPEAEKALNRKVSVGDIKISILKGIEADDFAIKNKDEKTDFLRCKSFILKYQLLPLLSKRVVLDELRLVSPAIMIERDTEGGFNFSGIGESSGPSETQKEKKADESRGLPVSLLVSRVEVRDARFSFVDRKKELPDLKGEINLEMGIRGTGNNVSSAGNIDLKLDEIAIRKPAPKNIRNLSSTLDYEASLDIKSKDIRIDKARLEIQGIPASVTGALKNLKTSPEIDIELSLQKLKGADITNLLSQFADLKGLSLSGNLGADVKISGIPVKPDTLNADGTVELEQLGIEYKNAHAVINGKLALKGRSVDFDLPVSVGKNNVRLKGHLKDYFSDRKVRLDIYSKKLVLDEVIPAGRPAATSASQETGKVPGRLSSDAEPLTLKLDADGELRIDRAVYKNMEMTDFFAKYIFRNNRFEITKMSAHAGKGSLSLNSAVDLSVPGYTYRLSAGINDLHAVEIVNSFFPKAKDTVYGILSAKLRLNGAGTMPKNIKKNLSADGDFVITDGKITNSRLSEELALFLGLSELRTIKLHQAEGTLKIRNAVGRLNSIFSSDDISMNPSGKIGLDETLDIAFDLKLSPGLTAKITRNNASIASYIQDDRGWGRIPLKVSGTFSAPSYSIDVEKAGKRIIKKKGSELLDKIFREKDNKEAGAENKDRREKKRPAEDLLKGFFK